jgi:hypothetical protein
MVDGTDAAIFGTYFDPHHTTVQNDFAFGDLNGDGYVDGTDAAIFGTFFGYGNGALDSYGNSTPQL